MSFLGQWHALTKLGFKNGYLKYNFSALLILLSGALMASVFSGRQPATVGLDVGISIIRLIFPFIIALTVQELLARDFERRYYLVSISYPLSRINYLLSRLIVVALLVLFSLIVMSILLALLVHWVGGSYQQATPVSMGWAYVQVVTAIYVEALVLIAFSVLLAVWAKTPSFVMIGTLGFALVARSYTSVIDLVASDRTLVSNSEEYGVGISVLRYLLPDIGSLDIREVALYGNWEALDPDWYISVMACVFYGFLLVVVAAGVLQRKRFY